MRGLTVTYYEAGVILWSLILWINVFLCYVEAIVNLASHPLVTFFLDCYFSFTIFLK